ncbi:hypothetical protein [Agreia sp. Leaf335]|nr:hypothetical protein [Agreia sp. Leaf335]
MSLEEAKAFEKIEVALAARTAAQVACGLVARGDEVSTLVS